MSRVMEQGSEHRLHAGAAIVNQEFGIWRSLVSGLFSHVLKSRQSAVRGLEL